MKKLTAYRKSAKTFLAIFSVLLGFAAICALALYLLSCIGVLTFPGREEVPSPGIHGEVGISLPPFTPLSESPSLLDRPEDKAALLIGQLPFETSFYIRANVKNVMLPATETTPEEAVFFSYDIWCYGDKYRVNCYNENQEADTVINDNGKTVTIINHKILDVQTFPSDGTYTLFSIAPFFYLELAETVTTCEIRDGMLYVTRGAEEFGVYQKCVYELAHGFPVSCETYENGIQTMAIVFSGADLDFAFRDYMFELSLTAE